MRTPETRYTSSVLTEALDRYMETGLDYDEICAAVEEEWPAQIAVILKEFILKTTCPHCFEFTNLAKAEYGDGEPIYVPICGCEIEQEWNALFAQDEPEETPAPEETP